MGASSPLTVPALGGDIYLNYHPSLHFPYLCAMLTVTQTLPLLQLWLLKELQLGNCTHGHTPTFSQLSSDTPVLTDIYRHTQSQRHFPFTVPHSSPWRPLLELQQGLVLGCESA